MNYIENLIPVHENVHIIQKSRGKNLSHPCKGFGTQRTSRFCSWLPGYHQFCLLKSPSLLQNFGFKEICNKLKCYIFKFLAQEDDHNVISK